MVSHMTDERLPHLNALEIVAEFVFRLEVGAPCSCVTIAEIVV